MTIPSPPQGVWHLGPIPLRAYALCIIAGIVVAVWLSERRFVARGGAPGTVIDVAVWAVPFGLSAGGSTTSPPTGGPTSARAATRSARYDLAGRPRHLGRGRARRRSGRGSAAAAAASRCRPSPTRSRPASSLAQAIGRLGNYFNQELYGAPTTLPWGLEIYRRVDPSTGAARRPRRGRARPHADRDRAADVPLRADLEPARRGAGGLGRPPVPARPRPGLRGLRRRLHRRAGSSSS